MLLAFVLSIPSALLLLAAGPVLAVLRQPADVVPLAAQYSVRMAPSVLPFFLFIVFRQSLQALGHTRAIVVTIIVANLVNALLNWVLIFGHLGLPAMGVAGSAWATTISRWLLCVSLPAIAWRPLRPHLRPIRPEIREFAP